MRELRGDETGEETCERAEIINGLLAVLPGKDLLSLDILHLLIFILPTFILLIAILLAIKASIALLTIDHPQLIIQNDFPQISTLFHKVPINLHPNQPPPALLPNHLPPRPTSRQHSLLPLASERLERLELGGHAGLEGLALGRGGIGGEEAERPVAEDETGSRIEVGDSVLLETALRSGDGGEE
jgi:hypothetical protein